VADAVPPASPEQIGAPPERKLIAPLWHTILFVLIILGLSALSYSATRRLLTSSSAGTMPGSARMFTYAATLVEEWVLFLYVYLGVRVRGSTIRERINARWANAGAVWRDIGIAALVWLGFVLIEVSSSVIFRAANGPGAKVVKELTPHTLLELPLWILVSISAGFCEEFIFRGYLQEQCKRFTGSAAAAVTIQAVFFGLGHGYQGWSLMLTIFFIGLLFGITAALRTSLAPTMLAHGWADSIVGIGAYALHALHRM
jgi:uncharacterized protein